MDVFVIVLGIFAIILAFQSIKIIPQQSAWVVERLGKFHATLEPGLNIVIPFVDRIAYRHRLTEFPLDIAPQVCGKRDLDKLLEDREAINRAVVFALDEASPNWGVKVLRYEIKDITPPQQVLAAMQKQITAEREKRALIAQSEGKKQEEINLAEGQMTASIRESEGTRQAAINNAQGEAEALLLVANATAESIRVVASAIQSEGGLSAVNLKVAERFVDAFGNIAKQGNTMILPGNAADIAGLVATAMQVVKKS